MPVLASVTVFAALLVAWNTTLAPLLPPRPYQVDLESERVLWMGPRRGPFLSGQDLDTAALLLVGDSRVNPGLDPAAFDDAGRGPSARLWGAWALLPELVDAVGTLAPRRMVLALSVLALGRKESMAGHAILVQPPPVFPMTGLGRSLAAWRAEQQQTLLARGAPPELLQLELDGFVTALRALAVWNSYQPAALDARLSHGAHALRRELVDTVSTSSWNEQWFDTSELRNTVAFYEGILASSTDEIRSQHLQDTRRKLKTLLAQGWAVTCVRMPVDPAIADIEDRFLAPGVLTELCAELGLKYFDEHRSPFATSDGSHLTRQEGRRFSVHLAQLLAAEP